MKNAARQAATESIGIRRIPKRWDKSLILAILTVLFGLWTIGNLRIHVVDDAYIFGRYAHNLAQYGQLVFNIGERVEGVTSLLWTLLVFLNERFLHIPFEEYVIWLSILILVILSLRIWHFCTRLEMPWVGLLSVGVLYTQTNFVLSSINGLEGVLYGYLLFELITSFWERKPSQSFIIGGLLFLTRPESAAILLLVFFLFLLTEKHRKPILTKFAIIYLGTVAGVTAFRYLYYGEIIPNSVIAKSIPLSFVLEYGSSAAYRYSLDFLRSTIILTLIVVTALLYLLSWLVNRSSTAKAGLLTQVFTPLVSSRERMTILLILLTIAFSFLVAFRNGGDWMPAYRLLSQYLPIYVILIPLLIREKVLDRRVLVSMALISSLFYFSNLAQIKIFDPEIVPRGGFYPDIIQRLTQPTVLEPHDQISAEAIGYLSYYLPDQPILDPLGLTDKHIAKYGYPALQYGKIDIPYLINQVKPAILLWHWGGHLKGYESIVEENYIVFCHYECGGLNSDLVLVRRDRLDVYQSAFHDLTPIDSLAKLLE